MNANSNARLALGVRQKAALSAPNRIAQEPESQEGRRNRNNSP